MRIFFLFYACSAWVFAPTNTTTVPRNYILPSVAVPRAFNWQNVVRLTTDRSYTAGPFVCQAAYVFAVTTMVSDRLAIMRNASFPEIILSKQLLLTCDTTNNGCSGGTLLHALHYIHDIGIPDETCTPYIARGRDTGEVCLKSTVCSTCGADGSCQIIPEKHIYRFVVYAFGVLTGEEAMLQEIYQKGPIVCEIQYPPNTGPLDDRAHAVSVAGWTKKKWRIRNNVGVWKNSGWGHVGPRGENPLRIEEYCVFADPKFPTFSGLSGTIPVMKPSNERHERIYNLLSSEDKIYEQPLIDDSTSLIPTPRNNVTFECTRNSNQCTPEDCICGPLYTRHNVSVVKGDGTKELCYSCLPKVRGISNVVPPEDLPLAHDWRYVNNVSYVSVLRNQHLPTYCGSCWAVSGTSALADRFQIKLGNHYPILLSPQAILDCKRGGTCNGGSALHMYASIYEDGVPHDSCRNYRAKNGGTEWGDRCPSYATCSYCEGKHIDSCHPASDFLLYYVSDFGKVRGADMMKGEIMRGPIVCSVMSTRKMEAYTGGLFWEKRAHVGLNHDVSVLGWGLVDTNIAENVKVEYWVARNSWGSFWGELGFMRILMYRNNNGIETSCTWAVPGKIRRVPTLSVREVAIE